jgi:hypothetical protein
MVIKTLIPLFLIVVSSCATTNQPGTVNYKIVPGSRVYTDNFIFNNKGNIIIKRDSGFMGSALNSIFYINDIKIVKLLPGEYYQFNLPKGIYFLGLASGEGVNLGTPFVRSLKIEITDENKRLTFRVFPMPTQGLVIEEVYQ